MSVLAKVTKLIALTASAEPEEARTAAALACKLIREHGLEVVEKSTPRATSSSFEGAAGYAPSNIDEILRKATEAMRRNAEDATAGRHWNVKATGPRVIVSKFDSLCAECRWRIHAGEECYWERPKGVWHLDCDAAAAARKAHDAAKAQP